MKYYFCETDTRNRIPYGINRNRGLDIRHICWENWDRLPRFPLLEMTFPEEGFFPDILCEPCVMVSETCMDVILMYEMYQGETKSKRLKVWDKQKGINATYYLPLLPRIDCLSEDTVCNSIGNRILKPILKKEKIGEYVVFLVKGYKRNGFVARLDYVESILRRKAEGIRFEEIEVKGN